MDSKKPRKQRKFRYTAPLHTRRNFVNAHLSKELKTKEKKRSMAVRTGDKVKIMRGQFKGKEGIVKEVDLKKSIVFIEGITRKKMNGQEAFVPFDSSKLLITSLKEEPKRGKVS